MAMNLRRRELLALLGSGPLLLGWPGLTAAATGRDTRLIVVLLRGGMDGLAAVPAYAEPALAGLRGALHTGAPGTAGASLKLDGTFALHPALAQCAALWGSGEFAVVHAVAPPYHGRSHFEAQDCLENGSAGPHLLRDGWLNRAAASLPGMQGLAVASALPLILRGAAPVETWSPSPLPEVSDDLAQRVARLYARDPRLSAPFAQALSANGMSMDAGSGLRTRLPDAMRAAARFIGGDADLRAVLVQDSGWDTHARQGAADGALARKLEGLDQALAAAKTALGPQWQRTVIVVATEFGRTVKVNGSGGTDHGTGGVMLLAGGAVRGGKVHGDWPGLGAGALLEGRDLRPTSDSRAVFKALLRDHLGVSESALETAVFPDSRAVAPLQGLVRT